MTTETANGLLRDALAHLKAGGQYASFDLQEQIETFLAAGEGEALGYVVTYADPVYQRLGRQFIKSKAAADQMASEGEGSYVPVYIRPAPSTAGDALDADYAELYRWLREHGARDGVICWSALGVGYQQVKEMDAAIRSAIQRERGE